MMKTFPFAVCFALLFAPFARALSPDTGARRFPTLSVQITDADVSPSLDAALADAMADPINSVRRLHFLLHVAGAVHRTLVVTRSLHLYTIPRANGGFLPLNGDKLSPLLPAHSALNIPKANSLFPPPGTDADVARYRLQQTVHLASRLNPDGTATVHYEIFEMLKALPQAASAAPAPLVTLQLADTQVFHSGQTVSLPIHTFGPGLRHHVFITITILPPGR